MIGLLDCNNFFVSCERLFRPDLFGKPVAVLSSNDGCIVARSNEVKDLGVPMGIPLFQAKQLVDMDKVTLFSSNFTLYRDISTRVMKVLSEEVGECQVYSIDEAFFTLPDTVSEAELARLRSRVMQKTGIPVSVGVGTTKTLAKVASDVGKRGSGVCLLDQTRWQQLAAEYPCGKIWRLGRQTVKKLTGMEVHTAAEFMALDPAVVQKQFGVGGRRVQTELLGTVVSTVGENSTDLQQSIMSSRSFAKTTTELSALESALSYHVSYLAEKLREKGLLTSRLHVSLRVSRHGDWSMRSRSADVSLTTPTQTTQALLAAVLESARDLYQSGVPYKKVGVTASGLVPESVLQSSLFTFTDTRHTVLDDIQDSLNQKFGKNTVRYATLRGSGPRTSATLRSPHYTTSWADIPSITT